VKMIVAYAADNKGVLVDIVGATQSKILKF
jgi:hypothetical protein